MRLNNRMLVLGLAAMLAGCGRGHGRDAAPYIAAPPVDDQAARYAGADTGQRPILRGVESPRAELPVSAVDQQAAPTDMPQGAGPRGTSGQDRYDAVGYAGLQTGSGGGAYGAATVTVAHASLPIGSYVELTALDTGHTIVAVVTDRGSGRRIVDLSPGAAQQLGVGEGAAVRVRLVSPSPQDQMALRSGQAAGARMDAPDTLLRALRKRLPAGGMAAQPMRRAPQPAPRRPAPVVAADDPGAGYDPPAPSRAPAASAPHRGLLVQVAAFSTRERAQLVAREIGGRIAVAGGVFRVQLGPFTDAAAAQRARDGVARRGYGDARILHVE